MIKIDTLKADYFKYKEEDSLLKNIFKLKEKLLSSDSEDFLQFHYEISNDSSVKDGIRNMIRSSFYSDIENKRDKDKVSLFLYKKYNNSVLDKEKSSILKILGHLKTSIAKQIAEKEINSFSFDLRYSSIIVLGWIGTPEDILLLNNQMLLDSSPTLRGYSATAMRQIWFNYPETGRDISDYIYNAVKKEKSEEALMSMLVSVQEILCKKFGIKESKYGDTSGNIEKTKEKFINYYDKNIKG